MLYALSEAVQRHRGVAHQRHQHGDRLARQRSATSSRSVEIYQGDRQNYEMPGAPRVQHGEGFHRRLAAQGLRRTWRWKWATSWRFEASSDHVSTHMSFANVLSDGRSRARPCWTPSRSATSTASTDNILAEFRSGRSHDGRCFSTSTPPDVAGEADRHRAVREGARSSRTTSTSIRTEPKKATVEFTWRDTAAQRGQDELLLRARRAGRTARSSGSRRCGSPTSSPPVRFSRLNRGLGSVSAAPCASSATRKLDFIRVPWRVSGPAAERPDGWSHGWSESRMSANSCGARMEAVTRFALFLLASVECGSAQHLPNGLYAVLNTSMGTITAQLYEKDTPVTVENFVALAQGDQGDEDSQDRKNGEGSAYMTTLRSTGWFQAR